MPPITGPIDPIRLPLESALTPAEALRWLSGDARPFALSGDWLGLGGVTVLGSEPVLVGAADDDPFALLDRQPAVVAGEVEARVGGGWVGWLGYGLGGLIERLPPAPPPVIARPSFSLAFYDHVLVHDGERWWFEALSGAERADAISERLELWRRRLAAPPPAAPELAPRPFGLAANGAYGHVAAVADCLQRVAAGELYQANLCLRLEADFDGDPVELFARALPSARPRFGALVDGVVSVSPERFLRRDGRLVFTEPIKGTRPRLGSEAQQADTREALRESAKDAAEHVMIVDLMRNDFGRVCEYGTVSAGEPRIESHPGVWQLVSTVSGRLRDQVSERGLLRATFPPGSVTGAPKVQAMKVIAALEATRREAYTGAIGIASPVAGLDLSVAIRTFELAHDRIWLGVGGGIVADSDPEQELDEAITKAAGPLAAIGGRLAVGAARLPSPRPVLGEPALSHGTRPDPAIGVFETVLVEDGVAIQLEAHLQRLAASLAELYGTSLADDVADRAAAMAAGAGVGRFRLRVLADPSGLVTLESLPAGATPADPVRLTPFVLPGGLGAHKWRDRRLLDTLGDRAPGTVPLLLDTDGLVLEAGYANVWIEERDELITPPTDGRILAGVTRAALLAQQRRAREEPIDVERLRRADGVLITSSIGGIRAAVLTDGFRAPPSV